MLPVVVRHAPVVLPHGHGEAAQFLQLEAVSGGDADNEKGVGPELLPSVIKYQQMFYLLRSLTSYSNVLQRTERF